METLQNVFDAFLTLPIRESVITSLHNQLLKYSAAIAAASAIGLELPLPKGVEGATVDADKWVKAVCRYCGAGCGVYAGVSKGKVVAIKGDKDNWNKGLLCIKGYYLPPILYANDRLKYPISDLTLSPERFMYVCGFTTRILLKA